MSTPLFEPAQIRLGGHSARGVKIVCGRCNGNMTTRMNTMAHGNDEQEQRIASRRFTNAGWFVGGMPSQHRCPRCIDKRKNERPFAKLDELKNGTAMTPADPTATNATALPTLFVGEDAQADSPVLKITVIEPAPAPAANENAAPERVMTRDESRLIYDRLNDVYVSESAGYKEGWSDKRVAQDMGVPAAWVAKVRDQWFGPNRDLGQVALIEAANKIVAAATALIDEIRTMHERGAAMHAELQKVGAQLAALEREIAA